MSRTLKIAAPVVVATVGFGLALAVVTDILPADAEKLIMTAIVMLAAIVLALIEAREKRSPVEGRATEMSAAQRRALIARVRNEWIGERDEQRELRGNAKLARDLSLGGELKVLLGKRLSDATSSASEPSSVEQAWKASGSNLVLLGAAGVGKSVQLLLLTEHLLDEAEQDLGKEIPVIIGLASWRPPAESTRRKEQEEQKAEKRATKGDKNEEKKAKKRRKKEQESWTKWGKQRARMREESRVQPFEEWVVNEVARNYGVNVDQVRDAIRRGTILPILDGLDEVAPDKRASQFEDMRAWINDAHCKPTSWILASRPQEYDELDGGHELALSPTCYWRVEPIDDQVRIAFLARAAERTGVDWSAVINALRTGSAPHLTEPSEIGRGPLETPLGLAIAAEAYRPDDTPDTPDPAELLDQAGGWDRLWERYTRQRATMTNVGGARAEATPELDPADCRRWLANLASGRLGPTREVNSKYLVAPSKPALWSIVGEELELDGVDFVEVLDEITDQEALRQDIRDEEFWASDWIATWITPLHVLGLVGLLGSLLIAFFAGLIGLLIGAIGLGGLNDHLAAAFCVISGLLLALIMVAFGYRWSVVAIPVCGAIASYIGADVGRSIADWVESVIRWLVNWLRSATSGPTARLEGSWLEQEAVPWLERNVGSWLEPLAVRTLDGLLVGAFAVLVGYLIGLVVALTLFGVRHRSLEAEETYQSRFERLYNGRMLVRWYHCGSPGRCSQPIDLLPSVEDWDRFLQWATHRGFLREVGDSRVWMHETLRTWFGSQAVEAELDRIGASHPAELDEHDTQAGDLTDRYSTADEPFGNPSRIGQAGPS